MIHACGPAKDMLPWFERMQRKCEKDNTDFTQEIPPQTIFEPVKGKTIYVIKEGNVRLYGPNPNEATVQKHNKCLETYQNIKSQLKHCFSG